MWLKPLDENSILNLANCDKNEIQGDFISWKSLPQKWQLGKRTEIERVELENLCKFDFMESKLLVLETVRKIEKKVVKV